MSDFVRSYAKTIVFFGIIGLIGGFFVGLYTLRQYPDSIIAELEGEIAAAGLGDFPIDIIVAITTAIQSAIYGAVFGLIGIIIARKIGLWRDECDIRAIPLLAAIFIAIVGGLLMIFADTLYFMEEFPAIAESYATKPTIIYLLACATYGAVIEEVMLRLFAMSLVAWVLWKIFEKDENEPSTALLIAANIVSSLLFAIGHLPMNILLFGDSPLIIARCILLNGVIGLGFGWLYRKFGLRYAMIAHGGCHIVSKLVWILFI